MVTDRISQLATAATVTVMFFSLLWLHPFLAGWSTTYHVAGSAAAALASAAIYRFLADRALWLFRRWQFLRKLVLGNAFIEGTWVGHYVHNNEHRFTIEQIDQSSGTTVIHGREFDADEKARAKWNSNAVSIDMTRRELLYSYTCQVFVTKHVQEGLGVFAIVFEVPGKAARTLDGYSVDLIDGDRDPNTEHKISDSVVKDEFALAEARRIFNVPK